MSRVGLAPFAAATLMISMSCGPVGGSDGTESHRAVGAFVVFSRPQMWIDRLETPVAAPVTVGSAPSQETMVSDRPDVVSIDPAGLLRAHRNGTTTIRSRGRGSSQIQVEIQVVNAIRVVPDSVELRPGGEVTLRVVEAETNREVPMERLQWQAEGPGLLSVLSGRVRALGPAGQAVIQARYGDLQATANVRVAGPAPALSIAPVNPTLKRGALLTFRATGEAGPVRAQWVSKNPTVVAEIGGGMFQAKSRGEALVCARALDQETCTKVGVRK